MKLWQKIFLISLALVMAAIDVTAYAVLGYSHRIMIDREQENAVSEHEYLAAGLSSKVLYERMRQSALMLEDDKVAKLLTQALESQMDGPQKAAVALWEDGKATPVAATADMQTFSNAQIPVPENDACQVVIRKAGNSRSLFVRSALDLEGRTYHLFTMRSADEVFSAYENQLAMVRLLSLILALVSGVVLMAAVILVLRPLGRIRQTLGQLEQGQYTARIPEKGSAEIRELSRGVNYMADAVQQHVEQVERTAEGRKRFIDSLAHEMKTPLTSILGFADLLRIQREVPPEQRQEYAGIIVEQTKRLRALSGKLLELATATETPLECSPLDVSELLGRVAAVMAVQADDKGVAFDIRTGGEWILADPELAASLLYNLADNALKASDAGQTVVLSSRRLNDRVEITVTDQGAGMSEETLQNATQPFYMADKARTRSAGGAGLGLSLCREIAAQHGGELTIQSQLGKGTSVTVSFAAAERGRTE